MITKDIVSFAFIGDDEELDRVPFVDIDHIKDSKVESVVENDASGPIHASLRIEIITKIEGYNSGRSYYLKTTDVETHMAVLKALHHNSKIAKKNQSSRFIRAQETARRIYEHNIFQAVVAIIILAVILSFTRGKSALTSFVSFFWQSFACTIVESQFGNNLTNPDGSNTTLKDYLDSFNLSFTVLFTIELMANAFSYWLIPFLSNSWCPLR